MNRAVICVWGCSPEGADHRVHFYYDQYIITEIINCVFSTLQFSKHFPFEASMVFDTPCGMGFIIPRTQIRKTEACISEATCSRLHKEGNKWLKSWSQNKVESAPRSRQSSSWILPIFINCIYIWLPLCLWKRRKERTHTLLTTLTPLIQWKLTAEAFLISWGERLMVLAVTQRNVILLSLHTSFNSPSCSF